MPAALSGLRRRRASAAGSFLFLVAAAAPVCLAGDLPSPLVYLTEIDPSIRQEIRYATPRNFTGAPVPGYEAGECILTRPAAEALSRVQDHLHDQGFVLKVYDCYRPEQSVRAFVKWVHGAHGGDPSYYPSVARRSLIAEGYIASRSGHSTGNAIDLTLVPLAASDAAPEAVPHQRASGSCTAPAGERAPDTSTDMGTGYDCFDPRSHTRAKGLTTEQMRLRTLLLDAMAAEGFTNYPKEWWHFTYGSGNGPRFDVPVKPRAGAASR